MALKTLLLFFAAKLLALTMYAQPRTNFGKTEKSILGPAEMTVLKTFLGKFSDSPIRDTIIIMYDFKREVCWDMLDMQSDEYIKGVLEGHNKKMQAIQETRDSVSLFEFRETGGGISKLKKWDTHIKIDSTKELYKLIIKKRSTCGTSAIIMPDGRVIITRSDPHFQSLNYTKKKIEEILGR